MIVQKWIKEQNLIIEHDRVIVGLSGGADSVCLLLLLCQLRQEMEFFLEAVHVEHGIRGEESRSDAAFAKVLCQNYQIPFTMKEINVPSFAKEQKLGLEEAARVLRYRCFEEIAAKKNAKIALAHHMEDNAETVLFQMARGSSLTGLCGMKPMRNSENGTIYIRPLLTMHRAEIESYLALHGQAYCTDSTNQELEYSRNYLRNVILPDLTKINTQAVTHINETAASLREVREFLDIEVQKYWEQAVRVEGDILVDIRLLQQMHTVLQKEIIYKAVSLMAGSKKDISAVHVAQVLALLQNQSGKSVTLPNGILAIKENETIRLLISDKKMDIIKESPKLEITSELLKNLLEKKESISLTLHGTKDILHLCVFEKENTKEKFPEKTYTKWVDYDKISEGFSIRTRQSKDYLICDAKGHKKKLKQYFVDEKIPLTKRNEILIFAQESKVFWVAGGRMSEHVKLTDQTKRVLEIRIQELEQ